MKWFKRKPKAEQQFWYFPPEPPLPPCPVHGNRCGTVFFDGKWFPTYEPCPALEDAIQRQQYNQTHEYFVNPKTGDIDIYPRR
jgi:hypothetical protein